jgi:hypothetical protein
MSGHLVALCSIPFFPLQYIIPDCTKSHQQRTYNNISMLVQTKVRISYFQFLFLEVNFKNSVTFNQLFIS